MKDFSMLPVSFALSSPEAAASVVVFYDEDKILVADKLLDSAAQTLVSGLLQKDDFKGSAGKTAGYKIALNDKIITVVVAGIGKTSDLTPLALQKIGASIITALHGGQETTAVVAPLGAGGSIEYAANDMAAGALLKGYRFDKYITKERPDVKKPKLSSLVFLVNDKKAAEVCFEKTSAFVRAVYLARTLQNEPSNILNPETYAEKIKEVFAKLPVSVKILGEKDMKKLGMGALLGVGQGSAVESQMVVMEYRGSKTNDGPIALVGKGVTFDTGGISIKPAANMEDMKWDMGGSAVVVATLQMLAEQKSPFHVVGVVGLVENMPSGTAQRPGDIVTSMSGQTIEVLNTDAEGRLVLSDALWYAQETFKPKTVIDFATLTGAIVVALGDLTAGLFSNNDKLAEALFAASNDANEPIWRFPLNEEYNKDMNSPIADMRNIGSGRGAGSITAAQFLQRFIQKDVAWAHIDIAGVTASKSGKDLAPKGATGFGVHLMERFFAAYSSSQS
jgi:leucyl aminopeptidase